MRLLLRQKPFGCDTYNGHLCQQSGPCGHALTTDYQMPTMNGLEFIGRLAKYGCKGITSNMLVMRDNIQAIDRQRDRRCAVGSFRNRSISNSSPGG